MPADLSDFRFRSTPEDNQMLAMLRQRADMEKSLLDQQLAKRRQEQQATMPNMVYEESGAPSYQAMSSEGGEYGGILPGNFPITQRYGNYNPGLYRGITKNSQHTGLDIGTPAGTSVMAPLQGRAIAGTDKNWGNYVLLEAADGNVYRFSHLSSQDPMFRASTGSYIPVQRGQRLGLTGSTGNSTGAHLDISVTRDGKFLDPLSIAGLQRVLAGGK